MVQLDLIELADLVRPSQLVDAIVAQNPQLPVPVPLEQFAMLAGISSIEPLTSDGFEGALIANPEKSSGTIFYNPRSPKPRQRFTIGHELGHFLLPWHRKSSFQCTAVDMTSAANGDWEIQANQFSAELLIPKALAIRRLRAMKNPELEHVQQLAEEFGTSMEMTARRYVELNEYPCAVVFSKGQDVRYIVRSELFEHRLSVRQGGKLPRESRSRDLTGDLDDWQELDAYWWLEQDENGELPDTVYEQTLRQADGYKMTLLTYESA